MLCRFAWCAVGAGRPRKKGRGDVLRPFLFAPPTPLPCGCKGPRQSYRCYAIRSHPSPPLFSRGCAAASAVFGARLNCACPLTVDPRSRATALWCLLSFPFLMLGTPVCCGSVRCAPVRLCFFERDHGDACCPPSVAVSYPAFTRSLCLRLFGPFFYSSRPACRAPPPLVSPLACRDSVLPRFDAFVLPFPKPPPRLPERPQCTPNSARARALRVQQRAGVTCAGCGAACAVA